MIANASTGISRATKRCPRIVPSLAVNVRTVKASKMLKTICWDKIADFLVYLADYALQERFVTLAMTTK